MDNSGNPLSVPEALHLCEDKAICYFIWSATNSQNVNCIGVEYGFVLGQEIDGGRGRERGGVIDEPVLDFFTAARPALGYDLRGGVGGGFSAMLGRNHALPIFKGVMTVNEAGGVTARVRGFQEKWGELGEKLFKSEASGCKLLFEARVRVSNEREIVIGVDIEATHDGGRQGEIERRCRLKDISMGPIYLPTFCQV
jgi:hypothetical protein